MGASTSGPGCEPTASAADGVFAESHPSRVVAEVFHPSEYIQDELSARQWDKFDLAVRMGGEIGRNVLMLDLYFVVGPTDRRCRMGDVMAHQLGVAFDVSHQFFLNLETAWLNHPSTQNLLGSDSDGPRMAETATQARGEAGPARAEGIAK